MNGRKIVEIRSFKASLREARKKLPFKTFIEQHGCSHTCLFCQTKDSVKLITRPVVTGRISRETIEAVNAIVLLWVALFHAHYPCANLVPP